MAGGPLAAAAALMRSFAMSDGIPRLRRALAADAPGLAALSEQLGYPVALEAIRQRLAHVLGLATDVVLVACDGSGVVIGWIHGSEQHLLEEEPRCEIMGLVVDRQRRRQGIGAHLIEALEQWARDRGLTGMSVRSNVVRVESHPFYEGRGYRRQKTQHVYRKPLIPVR
jgi:GNAT superfamily N-acetyltransferase